MSPISAREPYSKAHPYDRRLTPNWSGFSALWLLVGAHQETYGAPPRYKKTARFLAAGGFVSAAQGDEN